MPEIILKNKIKIMKKLLTLLALAAVSIVSCKKSTNVKPNGMEIPMPVSDEEGVLTTVISSEVRKIQNRIAAEYAAMRCNPNAPLSIASSFLPAESAVMFSDNWGRYCAKFSGALTVLANKDCYLPWKFGFISGQDNNTQNPPTGDTTQFSIQYGFFNEFGSFVTGNLNTAEVLPGQLYPNCSYGYTAIVSGASRRGGYFSEIKLKGGVVAKIDITIVLADNYTIYGSPIPSSAIIGQYACWLRCIRAAEQLNGSYVKYKVVIGPNSNNTIMGQSGNFMD